MKFLVLCFFSVNILSFLSLVSSDLSGDCFQLNGFLKRDNESTCCGNNVVCDTNGNIINLLLKSEDFANLDYSHFPIFNKLLKLEVSIRSINDNILPSRFFDQPMLNTLTIYESNITNIPNNINKNCPVTEINLEHNELTEFPSQFNVLKKLQHLYLWDNEISGIIDLKGFKNLNQIDVGKNQIDDMINIPNDIQTLFMFENPITKIPDEVPSLTDLTEIDFSNTKITEIPPNLFKLNKLSIFNIAHNPQLSTSIINFGRKNIKECSFEDTDIICYQPDTCASINANIYPECTEDQINGIISKQTKVTPNGDSKSKDIDSGNSNLTLFITIGGVAVLLILGIVGFLYAQKKKNKDNDKDNNSSNEDKNYDIVITEKIKKIKIYEDDKEKLENNNNNNNNNNDNNTNGNNYNYNNMHHMINSPNNSYFSLGMMNNNMSVPIHNYQPSSSFNVSTISPSIYSNRNDNDMNLIVRNEDIADTSSSINTNCNTNINLNSDSNDITNTYVNNDCNGEDERPPSYNIVSNNIHSNLTYEDIKLPLN